MRLFPPLFRMALAATTLGSLPACVDVPDFCQPGARDCSCAASGECLTGLTCVQGLCQAEDGEAGTDSGGPSESGSNDPSGSQDNDTSTDGSDTKDTGDATDRSVCSRLLECLSEAAPSEVPDAVAAYGPEGSCWVDADLEQVCLTACAESLSGYAGYASSCRECASSDDCTFFDDRNHCLAGTCVGCIDDTHCADNEQCLGGSRPQCVRMDGECEPDQIACPESPNYCIDMDWICDTEVDCPSGADEDYC